MGDSCCSRPGSDLGQGTGRAVCRTTYDHPVPLATEVQVFLEVNIGEKADEYTHLWWRLDAHGGYLLEERLVGTIPGTREDLRDAVIAQLHALQLLGAGYRGPDSSGAFMIYITRPEIITSS